MFTLKRATEVNKIFFDKVIKQNMQVVDMTLGNGFDALELLSRIGKKGHLYGFDIQEKAIAVTRCKLEEAGFYNYTLILDTHCNALNYINTPLDIAIFNLGYLPSCNKTITTVAANTIKAIGLIFSQLRIGGFIFITVYPGHEEGRREHNALLSMLPNVDQRIATILRFTFLNQMNTPPHTIIIEKIKEGTLFNENTYFE